MKKYKRGNITKCFGCDTLFVSQVDQDTLHKTIDALVPIETDTLNSMVCSHCGQEGMFTEPERDKQLIPYDRVAQAWSVHCYHYESLEEMVRSIYLVDLID